MSASGTAATGARAKSPSGGLLRRGKGTAKAADPNGARRVRLTAGTTPKPSTLTPFQRWAWRTFRTTVTSARPNPLLDEQLAKAHMRLRGDEYMAQVYATMVLVIAGLVVAGIGLDLLFGAAGLAFYLAAPIAAVIAAGIGFLVYIVLLALPKITANGRGKKIDERISAAMSFVSAMSSADVNVDQIFRELATQKIYGEVAEEAAWITRDTELLGVDILTALKDGATRTPSKNWQDFLQGVVTTATSGGQLKPYFLLKAEQFEQQHKIAMLKRVETMGLMAETFVTAVVAFPLFLVIIIAIFALVGSAGPGLMDDLFVIVMGMVPGLQIPFIFIMQSVASEV